MCFFFVKIANDIIEKTIFLKKEENEMKKNKDVLERLFRKYGELYARQIKYPEEMRRSIAFGFARRDGYITEEMFTYIRKKLENVWFKCEDFSYMIPNFEEYAERRDMLTERWLIQCGIG